jgi:tRNA U34 5-methylaminomethyl-2-thiouridine-forming methyltransferase MnmC
VIFLRSPHPEGSGEGIMNKVIKNPFTDGKEKYQLYISVYQLVTTSDGSNTIFVPELGEHYHSIYGAVQESLHIFINAGLACCSANPLNIFEVGFGTGLNVLLSALRNSEEIRKINYTSVEKYPLSEDITKTLNYHLFTNKEGARIFESIHRAKWGVMQKITSNFNLLKIKADITKTSFQGSFDLIYFDAFGPDKQPEMWSKEIFEMIGAMTAVNGIFVTYSSKGDVKRRLKSCGFNVKTIPGPPGKREIIRAVKI